MKQTCGEWCRICWNIAHKRLVTYKKYKLAESKQKGHGLKTLKEHLAKCGDEKNIFRDMNKEAIHLRAGGRSRIQQYKAKVKAREEMIHDIEAPGRDFWLLEEYEEECGKVAKTGAKVVSRRVPGYGKNRRACMS